MARDFPASMRIADTDPLWAYAVKHEVAEIFKAALKQ
ncbi:hypothetical protein EES42_19945 [Streptomyces sp. ADI95-17]|jgi:hypothetical protein|nr:hypothetical protein EES42_19945 [Streptomyces sp. ADI95-17]